MYCKTATLVTALLAFAALAQARTVYRNRVARQAGRGIFGSAVQPGNTDFGVLPVGLPDSTVPGGSPNNPDAPLQLNQINPPQPVNNLPLDQPALVQNDLPQQPVHPDGGLPPANIPGFAQGGGLPNPYDPYGKFNGGFGLGTSRGLTALGTGYRVPEYYGFDWPNNGLQVQKGVDVPILGHNVARYDESNLYVRPDGSVAQYAFGDNQGLTVLGSGYKDGWQGDAGINGYNFGDRFTVPVLGTNVVDVNDRSGFDLAKMKFDSGKDHQYGPIGFQTGGTQFESPWLGQLVQRGMWNGALEEAGYETDSAMPPGNIPGIPIVGKR